MDTNLWPSQSALWPTLRSWPTSLEMLIEGITWEHNSRQAERDTNLTLPDNVKQTLGVCLTFTLTVTKRKVTSCQMLRCKILSMWQEEETWKDIISVVITLQENSWPRCNNNYWAAHTVMYISSNISADFKKGQKLTQASKNSSLLIRICFLEIVIFFYYIIINPSINQLHLFGTGSQREASQRALCGQRQTNSSEPPEQQAASVANKNPWGGILEQSHRSEVICFKK